MDTKVDMTIDVPNQPNPIKSLVSMGQKYGLTVAQEDSTGGHEVDMEFLTTSMKVEQGGKVAIEYDSEKKSTDTKDRAAMAFQKMFDGLVGSKLQYYLNATNGVDHIDGVDALMNHLAAGGPATQNSGIKNMFNDASLMQMVGDSHALPPNPVQPSDTWPSRRTWRWANWATSRSIKILPLLDGNNMGRAFVPVWNLTVPSKARIARNRVPIRCP